MHTSKPRHSIILVMWASYFFFVVYGSLAPLDFRPLPLDQAWAIFQHMPMYALGVESRADWISNGVLYVPVGFLTAHLLIQKFLVVRRAPLIFLAGLFSIALAFSVEFTQIFFPPRTVSLNDLLAEIIGSVIGLMLAVWYSDWFKILLQAIFSNPRRLALWLLEAYLAGYVAFSLFPYDILLSGVELEQKLRGDNWGWLLAGVQQGKIIILLKTFSEVILTIPIGLLLGYRAVGKSVTFKKAGWFGFVLGFLIEMAQLFTASGVSQGISVLTRIAGVCCGLGLWQHRANWQHARLAALARRYAIPLGLSYLLVLLEVNGWFSQRWNGVDYAASRIDDLHFLPFYYHYFTTEAKAVVSLTYVCLMYLPVGLLTWAIRGSPGQAFFLAFLAGSLVETGKLFLQGMHPDPTNILLGALSSWGIFHLFRTLAETAPQSSAAEMTATDIPSEKLNTSPRKRLPVTGKRPKRWAAYAILLPLLAFAAYWAATFPTQPAVLCLFFAACAAIVWHRPALVAVILPAFLPVLDLAPWSGRFYLDEFDLLLLVCLAIGYARVPPAPREAERADTFLALTSSLLAITFAISTLRGLTPWETPDANAYTNYYSPFNALRIAKGALWAFLSYGLLRRLVVAGKDVERLLAWGLVGGLAMTVMVVFWERVTFSGLFNFANDYRITGPFSSMHTGGAYIECFLTIATPFLIVVLLQSRSWMVRIACALLLLATTYALMVTFSRNGYFAFALALTVVLFFATFESGQLQQRGILVVALAGAMLAVAFPVFTGQYAQDRIATVAKDYTVRHAHWEDALGIRTPDLATTVFGMGLGRYPESHYLLSREGGRSGSYQLKREDGNVFLRLVSGSSIYVEQLVAVEPRQKYLLKLDARTGNPDATITIPICEKWLLASYNCIWSTVNVGKETGIWHHFEIQLSADRLINSSWYARRPIKLAVYNGNAKATIDVDNVMLETAGGDDLLRNGDFSKELDHWFFTADSHLQWHAKSQPVAVLFDQGWFGLIVLFIFAILAIKRAVGRAWRGDLHAAAAFAAFSGFLVVGLFDTLIDAPRFLFLFLLLGWLCMSRMPTELRGQQSG